MEPQHTCIVLRYSPIELSQEEEEEKLLQPMTLEADRRPSTRGAMLDPSLQQDPKLQLEIGICGNTQADGTEVLEVNLKGNTNNVTLALHCLTGCTG